MILPETAAHRVVENRVSPSIKTALHAFTNHQTEPDPAKVRTWTDRSKSFSVEAQFLALKDGKIHLHKMNGVKIAVPVAKMSVEDLEYVERLTGESLDEDKPLSEIKKQRSPTRPLSTDSRPTGAGATIEKKPDYDWFQFFLSCDVAVGLCERYAQAFAKDSMDESVLPDVDATVLRTLGLREGDIIKVMRFLDNKYGRGKNKRNVSFGGEEVIAGEGDGSGSLFSGPGGALKNNTRKGRPAPAVQTSDVVDPKAFSQDAKVSSPKPSDDRVATPLTSAPVPAKKETTGSFDDDAWDVKPTKQPEPAPAPAPAPAATQPAQPAQTPSGPPTLSAAFQELSLLSPPLEPSKTQPPPQQPQITLPPPQPQQQPQVQSQPPQPTGATPGFFAGLNQQPTGFQQPQVGLNQQQNIARARPPPGQFPQAGNSLLLPQPPARPLSAPQAAQPSGFAPPPLAPQMTGLPNSTGFQAQVAPPGQSLNDLNQARLQQQYTAQQQQFQQQQNFQPGFNSPQNPGLLQQPTGFNQFNPGFQQLPPQQTSFPQQQNTFQNGSPFADPRNQQLSPIQAQPTGFQSSFPQQQFPQPTGVNSFLPPPLLPQPSGINQQNGFNQNQSFQRPPLPPIPQQPQSAPALVPQKTGPPPPVRFGVSADAKKLAAQPTGRRANLAQASKSYSILLVFDRIPTNNFLSPAKSFWILVRAFEELFPA